MKLSEWLKTEKFETKIKPELIRCFAVILFTSIYGIGFVWFINSQTNPRLYTSGVAGIVQLITDICKTYFNTDPGRVVEGALLIIINIPILILGWFGVSKRFTLYSLISIVIQATLIGFIPLVDFHLNGPEHVLAACIIGGVLTGIGTGGALRYGTSTGGMDIIGQFFSFKRGKSVGIISMAINVSIAIIGCIVLEAPLVLIYTIIRIVISTVVMDKIHTSYHYIAASIISNTPEPIIEEILTKMGRGVTLSKVKGAYSSHEKIELSVVISKYEQQALLEITNQIDPKAFVVIKPINKVYGNFRKKTIA